MSKTLVEAPLTTPNARSKLKAGIHWRGIDPDTHLGYRKGARGGRWVVRWYRGEGGYSQSTLATADDKFPADGKEILSFNQASRHAREHVHEERSGLRAIANGTVLTVRDAVESYVAMREQRERDNEGQGGPLKRAARSSLGRHVLQSRLAAIPLHKLDDDDLRSWRASLPDTLAHGTVRRITNDLKAALNMAVEVHRKKMPVELKLVIQSGLKADQPRSAEARRQVLSDKELGSLIQAAFDVDKEQGWEGDLYRLILILAATGGRFSQVRRLTVADLQFDQCRIMLPLSRKGRGQKKTEKIAVPLAADIIIAFRSVCDGRASISPLLERWRHKQVGPAKWERVNRSPWRAASELNTVWEAIVTKAGLDNQTVPYSLRHTSIVRGLRVGLPTRL
ncbi:MAG: integrase, partial [Methylocystaceae bacterium]|nr:integrase [Methylocystaceae bacterium]